MLTKRQMEVAELAAQGYINRDIGNLLEINEETVRSHIQNMCKYLDKNSKAQVVIELVRSEHLVWDRNRNQLIINREMYG